MSSSQELALQEPPLLVSWRLMVSSNRCSQVAGRGEIYQSENASIWWATYGLAKMELDAEVQLDEAVVAHFPLLGIRGMIISHESSVYL